MESFKVGDMMPMNKPERPSTGRAFRKGYRAQLNALTFYLVSTIIALVFVLPLMWMVASSLRTPGYPPARGVEWLPHPLAWSNYTEIFDLIPMARYILNSLLVAGVAVLFTLVFGSLAGFGMSQLGSQIRRRLLVLSIGLLLVPLTALWLARFLLFTSLDWIDTYLALWAPAMMGSSPFFILLFYWAFRRLPVELFDAARLEGATPLIAWRQVALPLTRSTITVVAVLTFILYWNDFINPLLYLKSPGLYTLAVGLQQLQQLSRTNWPYLLAGAVVMTLPVIFLFLLVQKQLLAEIS
jgi:multiple sugar transport system permease protein